MLNYLLLAIPVIFLVSSVYIAVMAVKKGTKTRNAAAAQLLSFFVVCAVVFLVPMTGLAAGTNDTAAPVATAAVASASTDNSTGLGLIAAALVTGLAGIGGGIAVAAAAPAAIGATSEDPKAFGKALIFVALGEGIALYGLLVSILILNKI